MTNSWAAIGLIIPFCLTSVSAQEEERQLVFPNVVSGFIGDLLFQDILVVLNNGDETLRVDLQIYTNEGAERRPSDVLEVPPGGFSSSVTP